MARSKYETKIVPKLNMICRMAAAGATNNEIATAVGVSRSSLQSYLVKYPDFRRALAGEKIAADNAVEDSAYNLALGYKVKVKKPHKVTTRHFDDNGKLINTKEEIVMIEEEQYITPSSTTQMWWMKNRQPDKWNEKVTVELDGSVSIESVIKELIDKKEY